MIGKTDRSRIKWFVSVSLLLFVFGTGYAFLKLPDIIRDANYQYQLERTHAKLAEAENQYRRGDQTAAIQVYEDLWNIRAQWWEFVCPDEVLCRIRQHKLGGVVFLI